MLIGTNEKVRKLATKKLNATVKQVF